VPLDNSHWVLLTHVINRLKLQVQTGPAEERVFAVGGLLRLLTDREIREAAAAEADAMAEQRRVPISGGGDGSGGGECIKFAVPATRCARDLY
jgi:hypothetical protein